MAPRSSHSRNSTCCQRRSADSSQTVPWAQPPAVPCPPAHPPPTTYPLCSSSDGALPTCPRPYSSSICCATCCESVTPSCGLTHLLVLDCPFCSFLSHEVMTRIVFGLTHRPYFLAVLCPGSAPLGCCFHPWTLSWLMPTPPLCPWCCSPGVPRHKDFVLFGGSCHLLQASTSQTAVCSICLETLSLFPIRFFSLLSYIKAVAHTQIQNHVTFNVL